MPRALITGIDGQDGRYLAELLVSKGYETFGMIRGQNNPRGQLVRDEIPAVELIEGDLQDLSSLIARRGRADPGGVHTLGTERRCALARPSRADGGHHR